MVCVVSVGRVPRSDIISIGGGVFCLFVCGIFVVCLFVCF